MHVTSNVVFFPLDKIIILEDRQRQEFDPKALLELAQSIRDHQMLTPISLVSMDKPELVAGERRIRAVDALHKKGRVIRFNEMEVPVGTIPVVFTGSLTKLQAEELELAENFHRANLTWQEEAKAIQRLTALRMEQHKEDPVNVPAPTVATIAEETKASSKDKIYTNQKVARHLDDPDVSKAKNLREAAKIIARKDKEKKIQAAAAGIDVSASLHTLFHGDCRDFTRTLEDGSISVIVTDPPYGIDMHKDQSWDGTRHEYDDTENYVFNLFEELIPLWTQKTAKEAHLYIFCDYSKFEKIKALLLCARYNEEMELEFKPEFMRIALQEFFGIKEDTMLRDNWDDWTARTQPVWDVMYFPMIWDKGNVASYPRPDHWPRKSYECILYAIKGDKKHNKLDLAVKNIPQIQNQDHPAGKPMALYRELLGRSAIPGDNVLDNFVGQGNFFRACNELKLYGYGSELSDKYIALAKLSLNDIS